MLVLLIQSLKLLWPLVFKSDRHVCSQIPDSFIPLYSENYAHDVSSTLFVEQLFKITTDKAVRLPTF